MMAWTKIFALVATIAAINGLAHGVEVIALWPEGTPSAVGTGEGHAPPLSLYLPTKEEATGVAIVVCPGGGYGGLATDHEGKQIGEWLIDNGIAGFVLRYRHGPDYQHPVPLMDAQRALRMVRAGAAGWGIDPTRIGILGFSAGGHLAATASTQFDEGSSAATDPVERLSARPDFSILLYPVITLEDPYAHAGSRRNLLGDNPDADLRRAMSANLRVTNDTPPAFLVHTHTDRVVPSMNSVLYYTALIEAGVPAELHIFERGRHGLGLAKKNPGMRLWPDLCIEWLRTREILR